MAKIKDKTVTVESLSILHEHNKSAYMTKVDLTGSGSLSINRKADTTIGTNSVAIGFNGTASASYSYVEDDSNTAREFYISSP